MKTLFGSQSETQSTNTRAALAKAFETADAKVPEKERAELFLASHLEPALLPLLDRRAALLRGLMNTDALDTLAAAQLVPDATAQSPMPLDGSHLTLPELEKEIAVKRRAIQMQRDIVSRARAQWSALVCQQLESLHRQQLRRIAAALRELSDALRDHNELVSGLRDGEVNFTSDLRPMLLPSMDLDDENSSASLWLRDAKDNELL